MPVTGSSPVISTNFRSGARVVRERSAKPCFTGSNPVLTSIFLWCNGSTSGSEPEGDSSILSGPTQAGTVNGIL